MNRENATCFMLEDMGSSRYYLRRYSGDSKCTGSMGYHNAVSGVIADVVDDPDKPYSGTRPPEVDQADQRWPARCECGYEFTEADTRQVFASGLYRDTRTGATVTWEEAAAGAVRDARWWAEGAWMVKLPGGDEFMTQQKATNCACPPDPAHRCWTVTGTVPNLTVSPSIATPRWHGFLKNGVLTSC